MTPSMESADGPARPDLDYEAAERAAARSHAGGAWSTEHLRLCWIVLLSVGAILALVVALTVGGKAAAGVGVGIGIVGAFFTISSVVLAAVGSRFPETVLVAALLLYVVKIVILGFVIVLWPRTGPIDTRWMAIAVVIGLLAWIGAHLRWVWTAKVFYVDPH